MKEFKIQLTTIKDVQNFIREVMSFDMEIDLSSGRYIVDAKSIMGIFSLDLMNPITLTAHTESDKELTALEAALDSYIVK